MYWFVKSCIVFKFVDIIVMCVDVIVNVVKLSFKCGGGVCGVIYKVVNVFELVVECCSFVLCLIGIVVMIVVYGFLCCNIIYVVGFIWFGGFFGEVWCLLKCYKSVL